MTEEPSVVEIQFVRPSDDRLLDEIVALADQNRATLGLMPRGAFPQFAEKGELLAATAEGGQLAGYALFAVARGRVRLIHLCVPDAFRRRGVARSLIRRISETHSTLAEISLKCRRDFPAHDWWPELGFAVRGEVAGRGKDGSQLVVWVRSHGVPDLLTLIDEPVGIPVAIDHNVFIDLAIKPEATGAEESRALLADWITEQITLTVTQESRNEIARIKDSAEKERQRRELSVFPEFHHAASALDDARDRWNTAVGTIPPADKSDCNHIISAAAGGARILATRDERVINRYSDLAADVFGMRILRPADLIAHLDEIAHAVRYRPVELRGTGFTVSQYGAGAEQKLDRFLDHALGERKTAYHQLLRQVAADPNTVGTWVRDPGGSVVAAWAARPAADVLDVPLFRIDRSPIGATLGRLIAFDLRQRALERSLSAVTITETHLLPGLRSDLLSDGFVAIRDALVGAVLDVRTSSELRSVADDHPLGVQIQSAVQPGLDDHSALALERALWPAKLLDSELPSYLVPIQPRWAQDLFDLSPILWERPNLLGISREHVYYRTPGGNPKSPARIGWYASGKGSSRIGAVVAVSHLVDVVTDSPSWLFRRYQHLGVYTLKDVQASERRGVASALRFVDTEVLPNRVSLERLRTLDGGSLTGTLQSPTMITSALFGALYREGTGRGR